MPVGEAWESERRGLSLPPAFCKQCPAGVAWAFTFRTYGTRQGAVLGVTGILPLWGIGCGGVRVYFLRKLAFFMVIIPESEY